MPAAADRLQILAEFRHQLRLFLHFSEIAQRRSVVFSRNNINSCSKSLEPPTMWLRRLAMRLSVFGLCHNTVVELSNRCETASLIARKQAGSDRRCVLKSLTGRTEEARSSIYRPSM